MFTIATDHYIGDLFYPLSPFFNLLSFSKPFEFSKAASMTDSIVASTSEWLSRQRHEVG